MSYDEYHKESMRTYAQRSVDIIQREAIKLNALGYDITDTLDNMRDINHILPRSGGINISIVDTKEERENV